jgi:hypothetical protein
MEHICCAISINQFRSFGGEWGDQFSNAKKYSWTHCYDGELQRQRGKNLQRN